MNIFIAGFIYASLFLIEWFLLSKREALLVKVSMVPVDYRADSKLDSLNKQINNLERTILAVFLVLLVVAFTLSGMVETW